MALPSDALAIASRSEPAPLSEVVVTIRMLANDFSGIALSGAVGDGRSLHPSARKVHTTRVAYRGRGSRGVTTVDMGVSPKSLLSRGVRGPGLNARIRDTDSPIWIPTARPAGRVCPMRRPRHVGVAVVLPY